MGDEVGIANPRGWPGVCVGLGHCVLVGVCGREPGSRVRDPRSRGWRCVCEPGPYVLMVGIRSGNCGHACGNRELCAGSADMRARTANSRTGPRTRAPLTTWRLVVPLSVREATDPVITRDRAGHHAPQERSSSATGLVIVRDWADYGRRRDWLSCAAGMVMVRGRNGHRGRRGWWSRTAGMVVVRGGNGHSGRWDWLSCVIGLVIAVSRTGDFGQRDWLSCAAGMVIVRGWNGRHGLLSGVRRAARARASCGAFTFLSLSK